MAQDSTLTIYLVPAHLTKANPQFHSSLIEHQVKNVVT